MRARDRLLACATSAASLAAGIVLSAAVGLAVAGCGGNKNNANTTSAASTPITGTTPTTNIPSPAPTPNDSLTGFGATNAAWDAHHTPDPVFASGAVYNPDPSLPQVNGHEGADYAEVLHEDGRVLGYDLRFPNISITAAKAKVAEELPPDARAVTFVVKDTCAFELLRSATLGRALGGHAVGDRSGAVLVEFGSGVNEDHYNPSAVYDAIFSLGATSPSTIPAC